MEKEYTKKYGVINKRIYRIWTGMKYRCNKTSSSTENWNGRGITYCDEWEDFSNFNNWALKNGYKDRLTLDRIDNDGNYYPENCRWATYSQQNKNKRKYRRMNKLT